MIWDGSGIIHFHFIPTTWHLDVTDFYFRYNQQGVLEYTTLRGNTGTWSQISHDINYRSLNVVNKTLNNVFQFVEVLPNGW